MPDLSRLSILTIAAVVLVLLGAAVGWWLNGLYLGRENAELRQAAAEHDAAAARAAVQDLIQAGERIKSAAADYAGIQNLLGTKIDTIQRTLKNAAPLPPGCLPTPDRVRAGSDAVAAGNAAAAGAR